MSSHPVPPIPRAEHGPLAWNDELLLGHAPMHHLYEEFVACLGDQQRAPDEILPAVLDTLIEHLAAHFGEEDRWMEEEAFPPRQCHLDEHAAVSRSAAEVHALLCCMARPSLAGALPMLWQTGFPATPPTSTPPWRTGCVRPGWEANLWSCAAAPSVIWCRAGCIRRRLLSSCQTVKTMLHQLRRTMVRPPPGGLDAAGEACSLRLRPNPVRLRSRPSPTGCFRTFAYHSCIHVKTQSHIGSCGHSRHADFQPSCMHVFLQRRRRAFVGKHDGSLVTRCF